MVLGLRLGQHWGELWESALMVGDHIGYLTRKRIASHASHVGEARARFGGSPWQGHPLWQNQLCLVQHLCWQPQQVISHAVPAASRAG
jgi:hypothetical protein